MSIKDVRKYYTQVEQQFFEMNQTAKELNEECSKGNIPQSMVDQAEQMVLPLKQNYERLSYIMYLFNKPNKDKKKWYDRQNKALNNAFGVMNATDKDSISEDYDVLKEFKEYVKELKV